jgi:hypothetical protein
MSDEFPVGNPAAGLALRPILFNILAIFFLVLTCLCPAFSLLIFASPDTALNPLPPRGLPTATAAATNTHTPIIDFPPTWTPTATAQPTETFTRPAAPTETLVYNPNPQDTPAPFVPFVVEGGNPVYSASPNGCAWLGVEGRVFDLTRTPLNNLLVRVQGTLSGKTIDLEQISGRADPGKDGEFAFKLADEPVLSLNSLSIQLLDGNRNPISDKIVFNTYAGCNKNLITVIFVQVNP